MSVATITQPTFNLPSRWALRVLSWLAFGLAAYLAWNAINQTPVAGCSVGSHNGCDAVLNSTWSEWLGIKVAVLGLACYATLAALSVLLGIQSSASRWITTAFLALAILAAGASLWFIGIQVFAIGEFCRYCVPTDICGIAIGAIAVWAVVRSSSGTGHLRHSGGSSSTLTALRSAIPSASRLAPVAGTRTASTASSSTSMPAVPRMTPSSGSRSVPLVGSVAMPRAAHRMVSPPSMPVAFGGALAMLVVLIGGQIVFPAKTFDLQQVALNDSIELSGTSGGKNNSEPSDAPQTRVAMRIPTEGATDSDGKASADTSNEQTEAPAAKQDNGEKNSADAGKSNPTEASSAQTAPAEPKRERKLKFLGGKLTLDTYNQPIIGSPEAPHVVVEMVSYDCQHCRKMNRFMKQALSRYGDQVALIVLIIPLDRTCNKLITDPAASHAGACSTARMALGIAKLKPTSFARFHEFLMSGKDNPPALESIIARAYSMADRTKLKEVRDSEEVAKQIAGYIDLFGTLSKQNTGKKTFGLPIQILGDQVMSGSVEKVDEVYKAWEKNLGVKPR
jgi:uncharacterized membrane protein/protein-disulfide isomerase